MNSLQLTGNWQSSRGAWINFFSEKPLSGRLWFGKIWVGWLHQSEFLEVLHRHSGTDSYKGTKWTLHLCLPKRAWYWMPFHALSFFSLPLHLSINTGLQLTEFIYISNVNNYILSKKSKKNLFHTKSNHQIILLMLDKDVASKIRSQIIVST